MLAALVCAPRPRRPRTRTIALVAALAGLGVWALWQRLLGGDKSSLSKVVATEQPVAGIPTVTPAATAISEKSIAVLPFTDMSEKQDQGYHADGMAEEIINLLAKVPDLLVPARTSGSTCYWLGRQLGWGRAASAVGGLVLMCSPFLSTKLEWPNHAYCGFLATFALALCRATRRRPGAHRRSSRSLPCCCKSAAMSPRADSKNKQVSIPHRLGQREAPNGPARGSPAGSSCRSSRPPARDPEERSEGAARHRREPR